MLPFPPPRLFAYSIVCVKRNEINSLENLPEAALVCGSVTDCLEHDALPSDMFQSREGEVVS